MILMRLNKVIGSCEITPYDKNKGQEGGWFPVDSVNFGFAPKGHADGEAGSSNSGGSGNGGGGSGGGGGGRGGGGGGGGAAGGGQGGGGQGGNEGFTQMQIGKAVDRATVKLMQLAMEARGFSAGNEMAVVADIHFIGSLRMEQASTFTFLRIHLDGVELDQWGISASGDERPTENFTLIYEKAAMCYQRTDGKTVEAPILAGWDQTNNSTWNVQTEFFPDFPN